MTHSSRRKFITAVAALAGTSVIPNMIHANSPGDKTTWDLSWLDKLKGKHKQVFDLSDAGSLRVVKNWLDAYEEVFGLVHPDISAIVGIGGPTFPVNAGDELYRKFPIGEHWKLNDPDTQKPALRNIYLDAGKTDPDQTKTVRALQARGVIFWQCNKALHKISKELGEKVKRPEAEVYEELKAGLNPGVIIVPAHTMFIGLVQERGCTYEAL